jgi:hypothetical protein
MQRDHAPIAKPRCHLQTKCFSTPEAAQDALATLTKGWRYHQLESSNLIAHKCYAAKCRPTPKIPLKDTQWQIQAHVRPAEEALGHRKPLKACCVLATPIDTSVLSDTAVISVAASKPVPIAQWPLFSSAVHEKAYAEWVQPRPRLSF